MEKSAFLPFLTFFDGCFFLMNLVACGSSSSSPSPATSAMGSTPPEWQVEGILQPDGIYRLTEWISTTFFFYSSKNLPSVLLSATTAFYNWPISGFAERDGRGAVLTEANVFSSHPSFTNRAKIWTNKLAKHLLSIFSVNREADRPSESA